MYTSNVLRAAMRGRGHTYIDVCGRRSGRDYMDNKHAARIAVKHGRWKLVLKKASTALATPDA